MGFGKSATPQERNYWLQDPIDDLERFVVALDRVTRVMHDFGGPFEEPDTVAQRIPRFIRASDTVHATAG